MSARPSWSRRLLVYGLLGILLALNLFKTGARRPDHAQTITIHTVDYAARPRCCGLGPFVLAGVWEISSPSEDFGGYSSLLVPAPGRFLALSDQGYWLRFDGPRAGLQHAALGPIFRSARLKNDFRDVEAAAFEPGSDHLWLATEGPGAILRLRNLEQDAAIRIIPGWQQASRNRGPEAMTRLRDGRFVALCECQSGWLDFRRHPGVLFSADPTQGTSAAHFEFAGPGGYRPTDMAQLPDGRVLVLMRALRWPIPARFSIKLVLADPRQIGEGVLWQGIEIAEFSSRLPVDDFEAMAIESQPHGPIIVWLLSDENRAVTQRVLLWKLELDPGDLSRIKQRAPATASAP